jgi:hypothetical protein
MWRGRAFLSFVRPDVYAVYSGFYLFFVVILFFFASSCLLLLLLWLSLSHIFHFSPSFIFFSLPPSHIIDLSSPSLIIFFFSPLSPVYHPVLISIYPTRVPFSFLLLSSSTNSFSFPCFDDDLHLRFSFILWCVNIYEYVCLYVPGYNVFRPLSIHSNLENQSFHVAQPLVLSFCLAPIFVLTSSCHDM